MGILELFHVVKNDGPTIPLKGTVKYLLYRSRYHSYLKDSEQKVLREDYGSVFFKRTDYHATYRV